MYASIFDNDTSLQIEYLPYELSSNKRRATNIQYHCLNSSSLIYFIYNYRIILLTLYISRLALLVVWSARASDYFAQFVIRYSSYILFLHFQRKHIVL
jgi:hypothetical protein